MLLRSPRFAGDITPPFELKGSLFTLTVLHLFRLDRAAIERHLAEKIKQAPSFFNNTPVVIDLEGLVEPPDGLDRVDFKDLDGLLRGHGMAPVGVRNGSPELQAVARHVGELAHGAERTPVRNHSTVAASPASKVDSFSSL